jgi:hypothetical protein
VDAQIGTDARCVVGRLLGAPLLLLALPDIKLLSARLVDPNDFGIERKRVELNVTSPCKS